MDVSIIIVNWNTKDLLINCISSVYQTIKKFSFEIWIVDNGSFDDSVRVAKELFPELKIIENQNNQGFAKACNQALRKIKGNYVILLNTDCILCNGAVDSVINFMNENEKVGVCGGQLLNLDGTKQNSIANTPTLLTELFNKSILRRLFPKKYLGKELNIEEPIEVESLVGAFLVLRKRAIDETGLLDESFFFYFEETDWCLNIRKNNWLIFFHPSAKVYHLQGQTAKRLHINSRIEYWRSRYIFFKKHYGNTVLIILMMGLLLKVSLGLLLNFFCCILTAFYYKRAVEKSKLYFMILLWHCLGCPPEYGLRKVSKNPEERTEKG